MWWTYKMNKSVLMKKSRSVLLPVLLIFLIFNSFFLLAGNFLIRWGLNNSVLIIANLLFFAITLVAFFMQQKALKNSNPNVFVRSVMGGMMIKMAICIVAVFVYAFAFKESFNKRTIIAAMFLYLIYLAAEVLVATKLNKQSNA